MIGWTLSHYTILEELGAGGMGTVYRARDTKLGRDAAIKVLREDLVSDPDRLRRFEQEARSASALNHPNIVTIYDIHLRQGSGGQVGTEDATPFIVMEYVEGETLRQLLDRGPLSTKKILHIAIQMAEGLAKAHSAGIVHRDLKPENLVITTDGFVKILDFGLAKLMPEFFASSSEMVTISKASTKEGAILGTVQYMSPEQAAGQPVDYRSDQFAFGSIVYEMATGKRAFEQKTGVQTLAAIIEKEPEPVLDINPKAPAFLLVTLKRCLAKNPEERYDSTRDLVMEIKAAQEVSEFPVASAPERESRETIDSIAVLPLTDLRAEPEQEFFADGMTEALITDLAKIRALKVISRTSVMRYKKTEKSIPEIAQELNVAAIVEGSVLRDGNRVRITAQLIEAETDRHLWAESYDRDMRDILVLQSEVAQAIAREIQVAVTPEETRRLAAARAIHPEAYQAYLKGHFHWYKQTPEHFDTALEYFELALDKEPDYALAYVGIANTWISRSDCGVVPFEKALPEAIKAATRARALNDTCAEVYHSLAMIHLAKRDWATAKREIRCAIELNPNSADAHLIYSDLLMSTGHSEEAMTEIERSLELDPLNFFYQCYYGWYMVYLGRNDDAIAQLRETLKMEPNFAAVRLGLWGAFYQKRQYPDALDEAKAFYAALGDGEIVDALEAGHGETGYRGAMLLAAEKLEARSHHTHVPATRIARMYAHAEDNERALAWLEKAFEAQENPLVHLGVSWDWHNLRDKARFRDLMERVNFND